MAVGYMDPGNWATDIAAGSQFGYALLWVVVASCFAAMLLQTLCVRLGIATGKDLAQLCREHFPRANPMLWLFAQIAIIACDFAEVLGTALALKLLVGLPLTYGILLTGLDTVVVLALQGKTNLYIERIIIAFVLLIAASFGLELFLSEPDPRAIVQGLVPQMGLFENAGAWPIAIGIIGATVMPHNLYLHSSAVNTRKLLPGVASQKEAVRLLTLNTVGTLGLAMLVNAAILIVAAAAFHTSGHTDVTEIDEAYNLLTPLLGTGLASLVFGIALFAAGQSSTFTGTMAGQIILQGFLRLRIPCWQQRFATRAMALVPAWLLITFNGEHALGRLLVDSQIILSMQLPFAMAPLIYFSSRKQLMGQWTLGLPLQCVAWLLFAIITSANLYLLYDIFLK